MKKFLLTLLLLVGSCFAVPCRSNQYDMLDWMSPVQGIRNGHFNVNNPVTGLFYWVKSGTGFPWDVDFYDANYIYQWVTEQDWSNPSTYKDFVHPLPWMPRCINIPSVPGKLSSITVPAARTDFHIHLNCTTDGYTKHNLGNIVNEIWGPYKLSFGGNLPPDQPTLTLSYRYSCNETFGNCKAKETFALQKGVGLAQWTLFKLQDSGQYVQLQQTTDNQLQWGTITPVHPCW